jgi:hypothetical protein
MRRLGLSRDLGTERNDVGGIPHGSPQQGPPQSTRTLAQITGEFKLSLNLRGFDYSFGFLIEARDASWKVLETRSDISFDPGIYAIACQNRRFRSQRKAWRGASRVAR